MDKKIVYSLTENFESFSMKTDDGVEFWLARDLQHLLGYGNWDNLKNVISKTETELSQIIFEQTGGNENYALIRSKEDQALFNKTIHQTKDKWNMKRSKPLADFIPTILLKAKDFATEITIFNAKDKKINLEKDISNEHVINNKTVRKTLISRGITPENLQPKEDVKFIRNSN
jgi:DNA-damage-inducible protein D